MATKTTTKTSKSATKETVSQEFAVIATGGKQYRVQVGDLIKIEKMEGDFKLGDKITFDKVLLVDNEKDTTIGTPYIKSAKVEALFQKASRYKTVDVIKYKSKSRYFKKNGHRQPYMEVKISAIN